MSLPVTHLLPLLAFGLVTQGCQPTEGEFPWPPQGGESEGDDTTEAPDLIGLSDDPGNDPRVPEEAALPWPSSYFLTPDAGTVTGYRISLPQGTLPRTLDAETDTTLYNLGDGFSGLGPFLALFPSGVDPQSLPAPGEESLGEDSSVMVVNLLTGEREPFLAELDAGAVDDPSRQTLIVRPLRRLKPGTRYAVAMRRLVDPDGQPVPPSEEFRALRDGLSTDSAAVESLRPGMEEVFTLLDGYGISREGLQLAWDFVTASDEWLTRDLLAMSQVVREWDQAWQANIDLDYWDEGSAGPYRLLRGSIVVPLFLNEDQHLVRDEQGRPIQTGEERIAWKVAIPAAAEGTLPLLLYGHGIFGSADEIEDGSTQPLVAAWGMPFIATDFVGITEVDAVRALLGVQDFNRFSEITDRVRQGLINFLALGRFGREELPALLMYDEASGTPGEPVLNGEMVYTGISMGGTVGGAYLALEPGVDVGLLVVGGGAWTHMFERSSNWVNGVGDVNLGDTFIEAVTDPVQRQVLLAGMEVLFDPADQMNWVHRATLEPLDFNTPKILGLHIAKNDTQVPNLISEMLARCSGVPLAVPSPYLETPWGLETASAPAESPLLGPGAFVFYDMGAPDNPTGNIPPPEDTGAHVAVRHSSSFQAQAGHFLWSGGETVSLCDGPCDPE